MNKKTSPTTPPIATRTMYRGCFTIGFLMFILCLLFPGNIMAQSDTIPSKRETVSTYLFGVGYTDMLDTYLSPEKFKGVEVRFLHQTTRQRPGSRWSRQMTTQSYVSEGSSRGDGTTLGLQANYGYAWHYNWEWMGGRLRLQAGGMVDGTIGVLYNLQNQNNPAQMRLFANIGPSAVGTYRFHIGRWPASVRYEFYAPLAGVMFSPNYGQSYYEIFTRGNYDHNVIPTTFIVTPSVRNLLTLQVSKGRNTYSIGYMGEIQQSEVNHLKQHIYSHLLMIGFVRHFKIVDIVP